MDRLAEGQSRPRFGQLAGRSVFNTRIDYHPNSILLTRSNRASPLLPVRILAPIKTAHRPVTRKYAAPVPVVGSLDRWYLSLPKKRISPSRAGGRSKTVVTNSTPKLVVPRTPARTAVRADACCGRCVLRFSGYVQPLLATAVARLLVSFRPS